MIVQFFENTKSNWTVYFKRINFILSELCLNKVKKRKLNSHVRLFVTSWNIHLARLLCPWNFPGKNTGVGSRSLLQRIFPIQGSNPGLPNCRQILYCLSHLGSPRILEWVVYPLLRDSSWPRNQTRVPCTAGRFFTSRATREALYHKK